MKMMVWFASGLVIAGLLSCSSARPVTSILAKTKWIHGAADCTSNTDQAIQVVKLNQGTFILRQNKCINYEAPFMFLLMGKRKAILMDTGATEDERTFPLFTTVDSLLQQWKASHGPVELIVAHTHSHGDHVAADNQFKNKPSVALVGKNVEDVQSFFKINEWPTQIVTFDLGGRLIDIIPIPGHHTTSIAVYDRQTNLLLTGDSFYPGRLYVQDWNAFVASTQRVTTFATTHPVSAIVGNHIEMTDTAGVDYATGTTFQPNEHVLPLQVVNLVELYTALQKLGHKPKKEIHDHFIIYPK